MNENDKEKDFRLSFPKDIMQLMDGFFNTSFAADIDRLQQGVKHPAIILNERMKLLTNAEGLNSPVGIDIPVLIKTEQAEPKATVVLLGQDPLRKCMDIERDKCLDHAFIGTPYRIHHTDGLPPATRVYPKLIKRLLEQGYNVYLTDVRKYFPSSSNKAAKEQGLTNVDLLVNELHCLSGTLILVLSGAQAQRFFEENKKRLENVVTSGHVVCLPHLSGFGASKQWRSRIDCATQDKKMEYIMNQINELS